MFKSVRLNTGLLAFLLCVSARAGDDVGTAFVFDLFWVSGGSPVSGNFDFEVKLYDDATAGSQLGSTVTFDNVAVTDGHYRFVLDFGGDVIIGEERSLQIGERDGADTDPDPYSSLGRFELYPVAHALAIPGLWTQQNGDDVAPNLIGGYYHNSVTSGVIGATIGGGGSDTKENVVTDDYGTIGGGENNQAGDGAGTTSDIGFATVGGGHDNIASGHGSTIAGGHENEVSGGDSTIGGGHLNVVSHHDATIAGGRENTVSGEFGFVGGGKGNTAGGGTLAWTTICGGLGNDATTIGATIGGGAGNEANSGYATISGGRENLASGTYATVSGGGPAVSSGNQATGDYSTVSDGGGGRIGDLYFFGNIASGDYSMVPGGRENTAAGDYSVAAGRRAKANHAGAMVLSDSQDADFASERADQLRVRMDGGARFDDGSKWVDLRDDGTNLINTSTGARLTVGGVWTNSSDRRLKENIERIDPGDILNRLATLEISTWNYTAEGAEVRHIGPMSQDFADSFGFGGTRTGISTVDADGISLAAIQGLLAELTTLRSEVESLRSRVHELERDVLGHCP